MNNDSQLSSNKGSMWNYHEAFSRNLGLVTPQEQDILRTKRAAIAGMGGVGGLHLITLARLGVGRFTIADPDAFEVANFNRQYGALIRNLGRNKAEVMAQEARQVNPELEITVLTEPITPQNVDDFLDGADVFLDGIDFFAFDVRRLLFQRARERGIWAVTAGPIGFSTCWLVFDPKGMSFDEYFAFSEGMSTLEKVAHFLVGLAPRATHLPYTDLSYVDPATGRGPSAGLACQLCAGVAAAEVLKILLARGGIKAVPWFGQFDAYRGILRRGRLLWGVKGPWQTVKRKILVRRLKKLGLEGLACRVR